MRKITDPKFRYTPSFNTDLRKSFRKYAQEQKDREARAKALAEDAKVTTLRRGAKQS
jgi:hypothetical protein